VGRTVFRYPPRSLETENYLIESLRIAVKVVNVDVSEIVQSRFGDVGWRYAEDCGGVPSVTADADAEFELWKVKVKDHRFGALLGLQLFNNP
jgi:hypothetical protein